MSTQDFSIYSQADKDHKTLYTQ